MTIKMLRISNFRNLASVELKPHCAGLNIVCGDNGGGKTSLLEAIHYLGLGRSFRTSTASRLIRHGEREFSLFIQLVTESDRDVGVGMMRDVSGTTRLRVNESDTASMTELASYLPIRLINSQSHHIFESGPTYRRKYLDWGLFYQNDAFLPSWRHYERVLKQRNAVLHERRPKRELDPWTDELVKYGLELDKMRKDYVTALAPLVAEMADSLLDLSELTFTYLPGWDESVSFAESLAESYPDEMRFGHTQCGPQRADLDIAVEGIPVKHFLSRGQQKLLICAMIIAQGKLLAARAKHGLIYLIDDLPAELDSLSRQKLLSLFSKQQTQIFITAIERNTICDLLGDKPDVPVRVFHVEHGNIVEVAEDAAL